jgi:hypothetical protein
MAWIAGVQVPDKAVACPTVNTTKPGGYFRLLSQVDACHPDWVQYNFTQQKVARRVNFRIRRQLTYGRRYETILASNFLFIRLRPGVKPIQEELDGSIREDAGTIPNHPDSSSEVSTGTDEALQSGASLSTMPE